ncbi:hypothetical protein HPB49_007217 [Dermacentor silvarum]|uniref:Uncharacterized protein n=1 Tax=Dermacentor silvarum TaxID=543639 RepID=A0ACB8CVP5_DERSI|nr:hypothetical protein HPB49_007217 [Dermacentor silvarum]
METDEAGIARTPTRWRERTTADREARCAEAVEAKDDIKTILRPKDGLNIRNTCGMSLDEAIRKEGVVGDDEMITICPNPTQNILVINTPHETTATKIAQIKVLTTNGKTHETNAYVSAPEQMVKGIIRNIPLKYTQDQLTHALVSSRNPSLTYAKRLGRTTTVILLYEGNRECGRLGHRPDVCPRPEIKLCQTCRSKNPSSEHECTPKCRICGEAHPTAERMCKAKYKLPHIVKQRRWRARSRAERERTLEEGKTTPQRTPSPSGYSMAEGKGQKDGAKFITDVRAEVEAGVGVEATTGTETAPCQTACGPHAARHIAQLPGYVTCGPPYECMGRDARVCTLVKRGTAFIEHELVLHEELDIDHVLIEVVPSSGRRKTGLFVPNVYSSPSQRNRTHTFDTLFREAMSKAASNSLLICGGFNAQHTQWGYGAD